MIYVIAVLEAQTWSIQMPELFFSAYSPPRNEQQIRATRVRLLEDLQFASKMVGVSLSSLLISTHVAPLRYQTYA
jgi:hypothetical protein